MKTVTAREGRDAARTRRSAGGTPPEITGLLEQVQADHTPVDVIVVDEQHRLNASPPTRNGERPRRGPKFSWPMTPISTPW